MIDQNARNIVIGILSEYSEKERIQKVIDKVKEESEPFVVVFGQPVDFSFKVKDSVFRFKVEWFLKGAGLL